MVSESDLPFKQSFRYGLFDPLNHPFTMVFTMVCLTLTTIRLLLELRANRARPWRHHVPSHPPSERDQIFSFFARFVLALAGIQRRVIKALEAHDLLKARQKTVCSKQGNGKSRFAERKAIEQEVLLPR
jgi:hypothetical protein